MSWPVDKFLTTAEACALLRVSDRSLRRWRQAGLLQAIKIGGVVRYSLSNLERAMGVDCDAENSRNDSGLHARR